MRILWTPHPPLRGAAVWLSGSVPDPRRDPRYLAGPLDGLLMRRVIDQRVDAAVRSLVAQVLLAGGRVVHGGHPTITRAIASQAGNWEMPAEEDPPIVLYQSAWFRNQAPPPGRQTMVDQGFAAVRWTPARLEEGRAGGRPLLSTEGGPIQPAWIEDWLPGQAALEAEAEKREALLAMRLTMLLDSQPRLAVCVGGMEGIVAESTLWWDLCEEGLLAGEPRMRAITSTFGASEQLDPQRALRVDEQAKNTTPPTAREDLLRPVNYDGLMRELVAGLQE